MMHERTNPNRLSDRLMVVLATIIGANIGMTLIHSVGVARVERSTTSTAPAADTTSTPSPASPADGSNQAD
jgi:hypothetical protein